MRVDMCMDMCMDMCVDMCVHMCIDMCTDLRIVMCIDMCIDICTDLRIDMCTDMCADLRIDMCIDLRIDLRIDMCIDIGLSSVKHHWKALVETVIRSTGQGLCTCAGNAVADGGIVLPCIVHVSRSVSCATASRSLPSDSVAPESLVHTDTLEVSTRQSSQTSRN